MNINERKNWVRLLTAVDAKQVQQLAQQITTDWELRYKSLPQSGLGMLKLRDGALQEPFYLGEIPVASAWVELTLPNGDKAEGAAQVMDDDKDLAEALAVCDAVLANQLAGHDLLTVLLQQGADKLDAEQRNRKQMLKRTHVDFSLLGAEEGEDDEQN
ncbi:MULTISPECIES: phosphonate C-P lyase system protein PhnG [Cycloclasticus]|uniref:phosphonate C-P lyase system protein PhnG n=1 Tax=Cycloclasticus TaxID=34067 RepID=UPI0024097A34|nr:MULTISPECIES: phosphonate C-P lyase system protein PhnG [Cycloclasticus]MBV1899186.1 phosphonate C-P lyase system protein PhnG [Cycloclasticus sp.]MDF1762456.1 phosphonate C-P lyase system protein PhnG [Thalassolituus sp.]MDF1830351.1 phosphonate C-P lyase system protein PhnG [Cycloclasticus pugetii]